MEQPRTTVPAKNGIVVAGRTNSFSLREAAHRLIEEGSQGMRRTPHMHLRLGSPFVKQARVIEAFVGRDEFQEKPFYFPITI